MWTDLLTTRYLLFTGKGGVGKTSLACAAAVALADHARKVLIVSTDPASNLDEVFETPLEATPTPIPGVDGLWGSNLDPVAAAARYRERAVGPYRGILPEAALRSIEEQLSGACTVEIAAFDEFATLLGDAGKTEAFDHIIFDTAPTGHTLRLLGLPAAWTTFVDSNTGGTSCLGPLAALRQQRALYGAALHALQDELQTTLVLVVRPEPTSLREANRAWAELNALGVRRAQLLINGMFSPQVSTDELAAAYSRCATASLAAMPAALQALPQQLIPLQPGNVVGLNGIRQLLCQEDIRPVAAPPILAQLPPMGDLSDLVKELVRTETGLVMTMGKGGVGKTTVAAELAQALARAGRRVLLTTTDPAAHVAEAVAEAVPGLEVQRIDPVVEVTAYREEVLATAGAELDAAGRALLEEDLRSPCTEEIAVFRAFARTVEAASDRIVVLDTAPTGHTLLLLDAAEAFHRQVARAQADVPECVRRLLPRLRDTQVTRVLIVTLAEPTPVHEAARLQDDLRRAGVEPYAWVINQSLLLRKPVEPVLAARAAAEWPLFNEVRGLAGNVLVAQAWQAPESA